MDNYPGDFWTSTQGHMKMKEEEGEKWREEKGEEEETSGALMAGLRVPLLW